HSPKAVSTLVATSIQQIEQQGLYSPNAFLCVERSPAERGCSARLKSCPDTCLASLQYMVYVNSENGLKGRQQRSQQRGCRGGTQLLPGALLHNASLLQHHHSLRTETSEDLSLMIYGNHAEAHGLAPEDQTINQLPYQLPVQ